MDLKEDILTEFYVLKREFLVNKPLLDALHIKAYLNELDFCISKQIHERKCVKLLIPNVIENSYVRKYGLTEFADYIYENYVGKKIVVLYGNCHTTIISQFLNSCPEFLKKHIIYPVKPIHTIDTPSYFDEPIFENCDIFIHQSIRLKNFYGEAYASENVIKRLNPNCQVISIPNVYQLPICFFPQYIREKNFCSRDKSTIFFRDVVLDEAYIKGAGVKEILKIYNNVQLFPEKVLSEKFNDFCVKVKSREADWDIKVLDYIINNYQTTQLFYDPNHPTNELLIYITMELLRHMGIKFDETIIKNADVEKLDSYEMPILPSVKEYFCMTFDCNELRCTGRKVQLGKMYQRDYIRQYLAMEWQNSEVPLKKRTISLITYCLMKGYNQLLKVGHWLGLQGIFEY